MLVRKSVVVLAVVLAWGALAVMLATFVILLANRASICS